MTAQIHFSINVSGGTDSCAKRFTSHLGDNKESVLGTDNEMLLPVRTELRRKRWKPDGEVGDWGSRYLVNNMDFGHTLENMRKLPSGGAPCIEQHERQEHPRRAEKRLC